MFMKYIFSCLPFLLMLNVHRTFGNSGIRTFEGRRIHISEVPFVVLVMPLSIKQGYCTGFIIAKDWITTAAHCFGDKEFNGSVQVAVGAHDSFDRSRNIAAASIIIHPDFKHKGTECDIALIYLEHEIQMSKVAEIIQIEDKEWPKQLLRRHCYTIGYGYHFNLERIGVLHGGQVTVGYGDYPYECDAAVHKTKGKNFIWSNANESTHICYGDSGSPLVCDRLAVGVAVISLKCGEGETDIRCGRDYVDAYLHLHHHLKWLRSYVSCLPSSCIGTFPTFAAANRNLNLSLYALIINIVVVIL